MTSNFYSSYEYLVLVVIRAQQWRNYHTDRRWSGLSWWQLPQFAKNCVRSSSHLYIDISFFKKIHV